jgi:hypothetical protein
MLDAAILSEPTQTPDLDRAAIRRAVPAGIAQVLYVLRFLIDYACHVAAKAEMCAMMDDLRPVIVPFAKSIQIDQLIIRVARGIKRALALQDMLRERAVTGRDIEPVQRRQRSGSGGGGSQRNGQDKDKPPQPERLPSAAEIAAELERKPIGAVVAAICHDIGIVPSDMTPEQWQALRAVISTYGGSQAKLWPAIANSLVAQTEAAGDDPDGAPPWPAILPRPTPDWHAFRDWQSTGPPGA